MTHKKTVGLIDKKKYWHLFYSVFMFSGAVKLQIVCSSVANFCKFITKTICFWWIRIYFMLLFKIRNKKNYVNGPLSWERVGQRMRNRLDKNNLDLVVFLAFWGVSCHAWDTCFYWCNLNAGHYKYKISSSNLVNWCGE